MSEPTVSDRLYAIKRAAYELASACEALAEARMDRDDDAPLTLTESDALLDLAGRVSGGAVSLVGEVLTP